MKKRIHSLLILSLAALAFGACKKDELKVVYEPGSAPALSSSITTLVLDPADSLTEAVKFTWTDPAYGFTNAEYTLKTNYLLEIDSAGKGFTKPQSVTVVNTREKAFLGGEFNLMLIKLGFKAGVTYTIDVRVTSSNYLDISKYQSNIVQMTVTPYSVKPAPKYPVPDNLYIVGDASPGGWTNPVPTPSQQFTKIDETTFGIIVQLTGGKHYLLLPTNGSWDHKYACADNSDPATKTNAPFTVDNGADIPSPDADGLYKIIVDFVTGEYTVTPATAADLPPSALFAVGDATPGGWNNPVPVPSQQFTQTSSAGFELTIDLTGGKHFLLLPNNGSWDHKYAVADNSLPEAKEGGTLTVDSGQDIPSPDADGTYKIVVEFITRTYTITKL